MRAVATLLDFLFPPRKEELLVRTLTLSAIAPFVSPTFFETATQEKIISLLPYHEESVRALILETKYHNNNRAATLLGELLSDFLNEYIEEETALSDRKIIIIPVPLSKKRRRSRGYNQTEKICTAAHQCTPYFELDTKTLSRIRDTEAQTSLSAKRRRHNMRDAFSAQTIDTSATYVVVDDVVTTGATLTAALATLTQAGASRVSGLALAH